MKRSILLIALVMVFGLICNGSVWAGNGNGMGDGTMLNVDLTNTTTISGIVYDAGTMGSGLSIDEGDGVITTVYGIGSLNFWDSLGVAKPAVGEEVSIDAVEVTFSDGSTRLIAVSLTVNDTFVTLRTDDGPAWRGINGQGGAQGAGTGTCPLTVE